MSHFTVLVIGDNPEDQLAGYHEFECTGVNDQYVVDVDITEEVQAQIDEYTALEGDAKVEDPIKEGLEWHGLDERVVESQAEVDTEGDHKFGYAIIQDGKLIKAVTRTNPRRKWDWYQLGGRWTGFFKLKPGREGMDGDPGIMTPRAKAGYTDQTLLENIDLEGMRAEAGNLAAEQWDKANAIIGHLPPAKPWSEFIAAREAAEAAGQTPLPLEESREAYWAQERVAAWQNAPNRDDFGWRESPEDYEVSREEFVMNARNKAIATFAVVKDGEWYERGKMGWWACVSDEKSDEDWIAQIGQLLDGLPGDTLVSCYDCHI